MKIPKLLMKATAAGIICVCGSSIFAAPEGVTPLTFEMMSKVTRKEDARSIFQKELKKLQGPSGGEEEAPAVFPAELKKFEGKRVRVSGFAVPYDDPEKMSKFLMLKAVVGCFFCAPPGENEVLFIRLGAKEKPPEIDGTKLTVEGTLHLKTPDSKDEEAKQFLFTIDDAKIIPIPH